LHPVDISDKVRTNLLNVLKGRVLPMLPPDLRIHPVQDDRTPELGYLLIAVPRSPIAPHAVRAGGRTGQPRYAYARRVGSTTAWLEESDIAALYRNRFRLAEQHIERVRNQLKDDTAWLADTRSHPLRLQMSLVPSTGAERRIERQFITEVRSFLGLLTSSSNAPATTLPKSLLSEVADVRRGRMRFGGNEIQAIWHADGGVTLTTELVAPDSTSEIPVLNLTLLEHRVLCMLHLACRYAEWAGAYGDADVLTCTTSPQRVQLDRTPLNGTTRYESGFPVESDAGRPCHAIGYLEALAGSYSQLQSTARRISADLLADYGVWDLTLLGDSGDVRLERLGAQDRADMEAWLVAVGALVSDPQ
ncbi:AlbA family DNA-binding domain-containing protein, partial [Streptomyces anulatus]|uniref:AlbA family DNA-binding domain-containing protein n=1 Tax=Streptomyces anulatus TaxID=1892 RepID=UPI0036D16D9F